MNWINAKDRLPEVDKRCLVINKDGVIQIGYRSPAFPCIINIPKLDTWRCERELAAWIYIDDIPKPEMK